MTARVLTQPARSAAWNMAVDEALLRLCKEQPVIRFYRWSEPAVTIGYFQKMEEVPAGRPFVRRYTGGGLVDHAIDVTYTLVIPRQHRLYALGTACSYEIVHASVAQGLKACGLTADLAEQEMEGNSSACFQKPVKFDVISGSQKLAGAAQRRTREGVLHQGSIVVPNPNFDQIKEALLPHLCQALECDGVDAEMTQEEIDRATELELTRYRREEWNQSR